MTIHSIVMSIECTLNIYYVLNQHLYTRGAHNNYTYKGSFKYYVWLEHVFLIDSANIV